MGTTMSSSGSFARMAALADTGTLIELFISRFTAVSSTIEACVWTAEASSSLPGNTSVVPLRAHFPPASETHAASRSAYLHAGCSPQGVHPDTARVAIAVARSGSWIFLPITPESIPFGTHDVAQLARELEAFRPLPVTARERVDGTPAEPETPAAASQTNGASVDIDALAERGLVGRAGLEPATYGLKVRSSTD